MKNDDTVTASEIAEWFYRPESWRLGRLGQPSANQPQRDRGTVRQAHLAVTETASGGSIAIGRWLILAALLALV